MASAIDTRMFHESKQSDMALFDRLCPANVQTGTRSFAPVMLKRLAKLGIVGKDADPNLLTDEEKARFVRLNIDPDSITWKRVVDICDRFLRGTFTLYIWLSQ